jgi:hypothetical protein
MFCLFGLTELHCAVVWQQSAYPGKWETPQEIFMASLFACCCRPVDFSPMAGNVLHRIKIV